jgi:hypothetical protein
MRSQLVNDICLETVVGDAQRWFKRSYPREYVRGRDTDKHMRAKIKREIDVMFITQNIEWDEELKAWYERMVRRYGGDVAVLPWN